MLRCPPCSPLTSGLARAISLNCLYIYNIIYQCPDIWSVTLDTHVSQATVDCKGGQKQEHVVPPQPVLVEGVGKVGDQQAEDRHVEAEPGQEESSPPRPHPVTGQTVHQGGDGGVEAEGPSGDDDERPVWRLDVVSDGQDDHSNSREEPAEVEEEETAEERQSSAQDSDWLVDIAECHQR